MPLTESVVIAAVALVVAVAAVGIGVGVRLVRDAQKKVTELRQTLKHLGDRPDMSRLLEQLSSMREARALLDNPYPRHRFIQCYSRQGRVAVLVEFGLEKSHTAESPEFTEISRSIAMHVAVLNPQSKPALLRQRYDRDPTATVEAALDAVATKVGDRLTITRFVRWDTQPQPPSLLEPAVAMRQGRT